MNLKGGKNKMSLTKRNFIKVAEILNKEIRLLKEAKNNSKTTIQDKNILNGRLLTLKLLSEDLIDYFKSENPNFKEETFRKAVLK